jgi:hypothetical protein
VQLPLVPTLLWRQPSGGTALLAELPPRELAAQWEEGTGLAYEASSSWHVRFPMRGGDPVAVLPLHLANHAAMPCAAGRLPIAFATEDLHERRGALVLRPRRLVWDGAAWSTAAPARIQVASR